MGEDSLFGRLWRRRRKQVTRPAQDASQDPAATSPTRADAQGRTVPTGSTQAWRRRTATQATEATWQDQSATRPTQPAPHDPATGPARATRQDPPARTPAGTPADTSPGTSQGAPPASATTADTPSDPDRPSNPGTPSGDRPADQVSWRTGELVLGTYEIREQLGAGGMGVVHRVRHRGWHQDLAVKSPRRALWRTGVAAFVAEAEVWVNLPPHPHLCTCHYVRVLGGVPRIFAEFVEGGSVAEALRAGRLDGIAGILDVAIQMAWGLRAAHEAGVVHQDVKPANALITPERWVKITDFGLASAQARAGAGGNGDGGGSRGSRADTGAGKSGTDGDGTESILATVRGLTPAYASPEQVAGQRAGRRSDVWSWAVSVLEMFTGQVTWGAGPLAGQALAGHLAAGPAPGRAAVPDDVAALLQECLTVDPAQRPADLGALAERLIVSYRGHVGAPYPRTAPGAVTALADGLNNKALSLMDLGRTEQADTYWQQALDADPHHIDATFNQLLARWRSGRITDVVLVDELARFRFALPDADTRQGEVAYLLGTAHLERGDAPAAAELLDEAPAGTPEIATAREAVALLGPAQDPPMHLEGHVGKTCPLAFSADGRRAASGGEDRTVRWWDLDTGQCLRTLTGHTARVYAVALSADGRHAASGSEDGTVRWWDLDTGGCLHVLAHPAGAQVQCVTVSPDGCHVLAGDHTGTLRCWDVATGRCVHAMPGHDGPVSEVVMTPDARWALSAGADGTVRRWDLTTGACASTDAAHTDAVNSLALTPDGTGYVSGSKDGTIRSWDLINGRCLRTLSYRDRMIGLASPSITSVAVSPDGYHAVAGDRDGAVTWWDLTTGRCLRTFSGHDEAATSLRMARDGRAVLSWGFDKTVRRWRLGLGTAASWRYSHPRSAVDLDTHANTFQDIVDRARSLLDHGDSRAAMAQLRRARSVPGFQQNTTLTHLWRRAGRDGERTTVLGTRQTRSLTTTGQIMTEAVAITPNGRYALASGGDCSVRWWDLRSDRCLHTLTGHTSFIPALAVTPDGRRAVSTGFDHVLRWWDLSTGRCRAALPVPTDDPVWGVALTRDGRRALTGGGDKVLRHWDLPGGRCLRTLTGHTGGIGDVAVTADGGHALSGSGDRTLRWWDLTSGECLHTLTGPADPVGSVAVTPNGRYAVSGDTGGAVHAWDLTSGRLLHTLTGHIAQINDVAISADGRHALSGAEDATLRWWDLTSGRCLHQVKTTYVTGAALTPDAEHAVSGTPDGSLLVWEVDWDYAFPDA